MIDIKTLANYSNYINLKLICSKADVNYSNVKQKVIRAKRGRRTKLNEKEIKTLTKQIRKIGSAFKELKNIK